MPRPPRSPRLRQYNVTCVCGRPLGNQQFGRPRKWCAECSANLNRKRMQQRRQPSVLR